MSSSGGWNIKFKSDIHNHDIAKDFEGHDILSRIKLDERLFVNDMKKYHMHRGT